MAVPRAGEGGMAGSARGHWVSFGDNLKSDCEDGCTTVNMPQTIEPYTLNELAPLYVNFMSRNLF